MIVVTTPSGNIGRHVVRRLLETGEPVRVMVRDRAKLAQDVRARVDIVEGSHEDAAVVDRAFKGADAVFWLCPPARSLTPEAQTVAFTRPAAEAIRRHRVSRIVAATTLGRGTAWENRAGMATASLRMVDLLCSTGAAVRGLALPAFMDNALQQLTTIKEGRMTGVINPARKLPHTATRDTGAAAAALLRDDTWTGQQDVPVLGPEELSYSDLATIISELLDREVRYEQSSFDSLQAQLVAAGMNRQFVSAYLEMLRAKDEGMDNVAPRTSAIIGPTSFRHWVESELREEILGRGSNRSSPDKQ